MGKGHRRSSADTLFASGSNVRLGPVLTVNLANPEQRAALERVHRAKTLEATRRATRKLSALVERKSTGTRLDALVRAITPTRIGRVLQRTPRSRRVPSTARRARSPGRSTDDPDLAPACPGGRRGVSGGRA